MEETKETILKKQVNKNNIMLILYLIISIIFAIPSVIYLIQNKTIYQFTNMFEYTYKIGGNLTDFILYAATFFALFALYFAILKNCEKIFKSKKKLFIFILIIGTIFCLIIPVTSLDVYSYIGNGWADAHYEENPYYKPVQEIMNEHGIDEMLGKVARCWREETVVYGAAWSLVCKFLTSISFGNITAALFIFKLAYLLIFLSCSNLIYKTTKRKIFVVMFALNPFILFEFLTNVHNDIFLMFFVLLAIYFIKEKKNVALSVASLAIATAMKYLSILLVPFFIVYALKNETMKNKIKKTIIYTIEFCLIIIAFYLVYIKNLDVLKGIFVQQNKYGRSIALGLWYLLNGDEKILSIIKIVELSVFAICYITILIKMFFSKNAKKLTFRKSLQTYQIFIIIFTFILITNFNSWYVIWLFPTLMWQKAKNIRSTLWLSFGAINSYGITYLTKVDDESVGIIYLITMILTVVILALRKKNKGETKER